MDKKSAYQILVGVGVAAFLVGLISRPAEEYREPPLPVAGPGYTEPLPSVGPADAPVVVIEVADLRCPHCARYHTLMKRLMTEHRDKVRFVFKHMPFISLDSERAAVAAMAANRQRKFWEYLDRVLLHQKDKSWTDEKLISYAAEIGLDTERFAQDLKDPALTHYVRKDKEAAQALGISKTPTLIVNGTVMPGWARAHDVRRAIQDAMDEVESAVKDKRAPSIVAARDAAAAIHHPAGNRFSELFLRNDITSLSSSE